MVALVSSLEDVVDAIKALNLALPDTPGLASRLGQAHAFYVIDDDGPNPQFGFSKFVGYRNLPPAKYLKDYKALDGRNTEFALSEWFDEVREGSPLYRDLFAKLSNWMASYGKRPRGGSKQKLRIMILRPEYRGDDSSLPNDRKLLELLIAVADMLPGAQRLELRSTL